MIHFKFSVHRKYI